ncbi:MAG: hypothetical protein M3O67_09010 [Bacteroidota bacterium]|nr:hypothetical protein [Bacteroidota bacterium]
MASNNQVDIEIDKLTRSIENTITGDSFKTEILLLSTKDLKQLKKTDWLFDWKAEAKNKDKLIYKIVIVDNSHVIQGLISLQDRGDHIFMHLIESNKFNRGTKKVYLGVPGNLVAYACKLSFDKGYDGYVSFESKTKLIDHYRLTLGADLLFGNIMAIDTKAATRLVDQYYPKNL